MMEYNGLNEFDIIGEAIYNKRIIARYQPIVSIVKKKIVAFEGLIRGINILNSEIIPPIEMFKYARNYDMTVMFDRLCREKCMGAFKNIYQINDKWNLFVNIDASVIEKLEGSNYFLNQVLEKKIPPKNIVIEINESGTENLNILEKFTSYYRKEGFLIALDDVGAGFSNLDRISIIKPNIIKLDALLVRNIQESYHKQEIFKCITGLANRIGAIVVAEGVENQIELNYVVEFGAHLVQGYFFSKPEFIDSTIIKKVNDKIESAAQEYKNYMILKSKKNRLYKYRIDKFLSKFVSELKTSVVTNFDSLILDFILKYKDFNIECGYILDENGIQITNTIFSEHKDTMCSQGIIFSPALKGEDNSLKKYYYELINSKTDNYFSEPYISYATGEICITLSKIFIHNNYKKYILCIDIAKS